MQESVPQPPSKHDEIAAMAYQIWEKNGRPADQEVQCWLEAEQSLRCSTKPAPAAETTAAPKSEPPPATAPAGKSKKQLGKTAKR